MDHRGLDAEVESVCGQLDGLRASAFTFWMDVYPPVPVEGPEPLVDHAQAVYRAGRVDMNVADVAAVDPKRWEKSLRADINRHGMFDTLLTDRSARTAADQLVDWLLLCLHDTLGDIRAAGVVTAQPRRYYAALWTDWLLVGETEAVVLSLWNDS